MVFVLLGILPMKAQQPIVWQTGETEVKVEFYTPTIVRIVKTPANHTYDKKSLVVLAKPEAVNITQKGLSASSGKLSVKMDARGALSFADGKGRILLREKSTQFEQLTTGGNAGSCKVGQTFTLK